MTFCRAGERFKKTKGNESENHLTSLIIIATSFFHPSLKCKIPPPLFNYTNPTRGKRKRKKICQNPKKKVLKVAEEEEKTKKKNFWQSQLPSDLLSTGSSPNIIYSLHSSGKMQETEWLYRTFWLEFLFINLPYFIGIFISFPSICLPRRLFPPSISVSIRSDEMVQTFSALSVSAAASSGIKRTPFSFPRDGFQTCIPPPFLCHYQISFDTSCRGLNFRYVTGDILPLRFSSSDLTPAGTRWKPFFARFIYVLVLFFRRVPMK